MHRVGVLTTQFDDRPHLTQSNKQTNSQSSNQLVAHQTNSDNQSKKQSNDRLNEQPVEDADARQLRKARALLIAKRDQHWRDVQSVNRAIEPPTANSPLFEHSPDKWIARSPTLIAVTGSHPLNAEPPLDRLLDRMIVPNEIFFVRNHGTVPNLSWNSHTIRIQGLVDRLIEYENEDGEATVTIDKLAAEQSTSQSIHLSMDTLAELPRHTVTTTIACDGNRRKELNMIRHTNGFNFGPSAVGTAEWTGVRLIDCLKLINVHNQTIYQSNQSSKRHPIYVHVAGADLLHAGRYETCFDLQQILDPNNEFILAYEMNDRPLAPDHGAPVRLVAPGHVGGRQVKWVEHIWLSFEASTNHYHVQDNKVLPMSVKTAAAAAAWWARTPPLYEMSVNSVIIKPQHEEWLNGKQQANKQSKEQSNQNQNDQYNIRGFAYSGGGRPIVRVEVTLDDGETWLEARLQYYDRSKKNQSINELPNSQHKYWTWVHWSCPVHIYQFYRARSIKCRAWDSAFNSQPSDPQWNFLGLNNNSYYTVAIDCDNPNSIFFKHPVQPGQLPNNGWMTSLLDDSRISEKSGSVNATDTTIGLRLFTQAEIKRNYGWMIISNRVYDFSSFLSDHPGGAVAIAAHSGENVTDLFYGIHAAEVWRAKEMFCIGAVQPPPTPRQLLERTTQVIEKPVKQSINQSNNQSSDLSDNFALQVFKWVNATLIKRIDVSDDVRLLTFAFVQSKEKQPTPKNLTDLENNQSKNGSEDPTNPQAFEQNQPHSHSSDHVNHSSQQSNNQTNNQSNNQSIKQTNKQTDKQTAKRVGLPIGQHVVIGASSKDHRFVARPYTPVRPLLEEEDDGTVDILLKVYFPIPRSDHILAPKQKPKPGGALSMILEEMKIGDRVKMKGPTGHVLYGSQGQFSYQSRGVQVSHISFVCGGTGLTPAYQMIKYILSHSDKDRTKLSLLYSAVTPRDLLLRDELLELASEHPDQFRLWFSVDRLSPPMKRDEWPFSVGFIDEAMIRAHVFPPSPSAVVFICGPAPMLEIAVWPNLVHYGYSKEEQILEF